MKESLWLFWSPESLTFIVVPQLVTSWGGLNTSYLNQTQCFRQSWWKSGNFYCRLRRSTSADLSFFSFFKTKVSNSAPTEILVLSPFPQINMSWMTHDSPSESDSWNDSFVHNFCLPDPISFRQSLLGSSQHFYPYFTLVTLLIIAF